MPGNSHLPCSVRLNEYSRIWAGLGFGSGFLWFVCFLDFCCCYVNIQCMTRFKFLQHYRMLLTMAGISEVFFSAFVLQLQFSTFVSLPQRGSFSMLLHPACGVDCRYLLPGAGMCGWVSSQCSPRQALCMWVSGVGLTQKFCPFSPWQLSYAFCLMQENVSCPFPVDERLLLESWVQDSCLSLSQE